MLQMCIRDSHIVFAPKFRRKIIYGKLRQDIAHILSVLCKRKGVKIVEAEMCPDHVHMLVEIPPSISAVSYTHLKLNSIGLSSISEAVLPLVNRGADSDRNATVYFGE